MPESWEGVLILLAVTVITVGADIARRRMAPPLDPHHYVPPVYPNADDYVPKRTSRKSDEEDDDNYWGYDEGGEGGNGHDVKDEGS